jgi:hypothetical protein
MLRNRIEKEENLIKGVNIAANPTKLALGYFTLLQNWIPSKKYKIKKKRGVALLEDGAFVAPVVHPHICGVTPTKSLATECGVECPLGQFAEVSDYVFDENDLSNSGPAIRIKEDSTEDLFYGLAAVYRREPTEKIVLGFWNYQDLATIPTILDTHNVVLVNGDDLKIESGAADPFTYLVKVNGSTVITYNDAGHVIDVTAPCVGFVQVTTVA